MKIRRKTGKARGGNPEKIHKNRNFKTLNTCIKKANRKRGEKKQKQK
jgi:hypothetical protein